MNVKKYDAEGVCPKCGHAQVSVAYCGGTFSSKEVEVNGVPMVLDGHRCFLGLVDEHLHRACAQCGFVWPERASDDEGKGGMAEVTVVAETGVAAER